MPDGALIIGGAILLSTILKIVTRERVKAFMGSAEITEGVPYLVRLTVTNQSTKAGIPVEATLGVGVSSVADSTILIPEQVAGEYFAAGETRTFDYDMVAPPGSGGQSGVITAWVKDPAGRVIAQATEDVIILAVIVPPFAGANINILSVDNIRVVSSGYSDSKPYYVLQQPMVKGTRPEFNITIEIIRWSQMDYWPRLFVLVDVLDDYSRVVSGSHSIPFRRVDGYSEPYFEPGEIVTIPISYYDPFLAGYQASLPRGSYHLKIEFDSGDTWWESARIQGLSTFWIFNALQIR